MKLSVAVDGFLMDYAIENSPATARTWKYCLKHLVEFLDDKDIQDIAPGELSAFMQYLSDEYTPNRPDGNEDPLSPAAIDNHWKSTRSLLKWADDVLGIENPSMDMPRLPNVRPTIRAFSIEEIKKLLYACEYSKEVECERRQPFRYRRPTRFRDKAIILTLLDTGIRIGELCRLKTNEINLETGEIVIAPHGSSVKSKPRIVYLGKSARRAVWTYLAKEPREGYENLFGIQPSSIRSVLKRMAERAGISTAHPHKFRHTFAINYLRNGGDVFTLQRLLGHSTLDMVRTYLDLSHSDLETAHRKASPVDRWQI